MKRAFRIAVAMAKFLVLVRAALPRWMQATLGVALVCTCLPGVPDFGLDEALYLAVGTVLWLRHRMLVRTIWHAACMEYPKI